MTQHTHTGYGWIPASERVRLGVGFWLLLIVFILLCLCGCASPKLVALDHPADAVEVHRHQMLRSGWTVTNWNGEEIWCAPGVKFRPRTPPLPTPPALKMRMMASEASDEVASSAVATTQTDTVIHITPEFQNVVVYDEQMKPIVGAGWIQDTNVYSPNYILWDGERLPGSHAFGSQQ